MYISVIDAEGEAQELLRVTPEQLDRLALIVDQVTAGCIRLEIENLLIDRDPEAMKYETL